MATGRTTAVGVFANQTQAQQAVEALRRAGFENDIGVTARHGDAATGETVGDNDPGDESYAAEGGLAGLATGAGVGALWGLGIVAGFLPAIGPAIAGGTLAAILSSAAAGAAAAGLAGALIGLGVPKEEAEFYEGELKAGRVVVTVKAGDRYDEAAAILRQYGAYDATNRIADSDAAFASSSRSETFDDDADVSGFQSSAMASSGTESSYASGAACDFQGDRENATIQAREEELRVRKERVPAGEVHVRKEVHTEHKTLEVPVSREEIVIERHAPTGARTADGAIGEGDEIRIPVSEEQVHVEKQAVVREEVNVGKRMVQDTETVEGTVRREEIHVDADDDVTVRDERNR